MTRIRSAALALAAAVLTLTSSMTGQTPEWGRPLKGTVVFEGATAFTAGEPQLIANSVVVVADGRFVGVGRQGDVEVPSGATRVDLAGKTIIPALVNAHVHLGYDRGATFSADNYTRENIISQLNRYAYAGVGAVTSLGTDAGDLASAIRTQQAAGLLGGALFLSAGRGLAMPDAGPGNAAMKPSAYGVSTDAEARSLVRALAGRKVDLVKIWVDDRNATVPKLTPALYRTIIAEAHLFGTPVIAHVYYLEDARDLVQAGVDGFAHLPRDLEVDDQLVVAMAKRGVFVLPNLAISENGMHASPPAWLDDPLLAELVPAESIERVRRSYAKRSFEAVERARATYARMQRSLAKLNAGGVRIGFGTDAGAVPDHFHAFTDHRELQLMVEAGMTPAEALTAATRGAADFLRLRQGVIEEDAPADFVVLDANPLEQITNTRKISAVYLRGVEVDRDTAPAAMPSRGQ